MRILKVGKVDKKHEQKRVTRRDGFVSNEPMAIIISWLSRAESSGKNCLV